jgi:hypothetical protein
VRPGELSKRRERSKEHGEHEATLLVFRVPRNHLGRAFRSSMSYCRVAPGRRCPATRTALLTLLYWLLAGALIAVGVWGIFSFGLPLLALGFTLAVLSGARKLPHIFWPPIAGVILFFTAYLVVAPLGCRSAPTVAHEIGPGDLESATTFTQPRVTCDRLVLPDTSGTENPPLWPAVLSAVAAAFGGAGLARLAILRKARRPAEAPQKPSRPSGR